MVFICLVAFFAVVAGVNAFMIREAVSTFSGLNTENSYQSGPRVRTRDRALEAQDELHWRVQARITPAANRHAQVEVAAATPGSTADWPGGNGAVRPSDRRAR